MLSANQTTLLRRIIDAGRPVAIAEIAGWEVGHPQPFGENAARNAIKRMEDRNLVSASGAGKTRTVTVTRAGIAELDEHAGALPPVDQDSGPVSATRNYVVLEEIDIEDLSVEELDDLLGEINSFYVKRAVVDARNTDHALRQTGEKLAEEGDVDTTLVPVAERMWQPEVVRVANRRSISIGAEA